MIEQMRYCNNQKCLRYQIPAEFTRSKYCPSCNTKTKFLNHAEDIPPAAYVDAGKGQLVLLASNPGASNTKSNDGGPMVFESGCDVKGCPVAPDGTAIKIPFTLYQKWIYLAQRFKVEWIAYLTGELREGAWWIDEDGMYFPMQRATGVNVWAETCERKPRTIAAIHSHVSMQAYFSGTDEHHFNNDIEMVVNDKGELDCVTRVKLECGRFQRVRSTMELILPPEIVALKADLNSKLLIVKRDEPRSNATTSTHYPSASSRNTTSGGSGYTVNDKRGHCQHGKAWSVRCEDCELDYWISGQSHDSGGDAVSTKTQGAIFRTDLSPQASPTNSNGGSSGDPYAAARTTENPSDKLVEMATSILVRRANHEAKTTQVE